jgi:hypothetical protein
MHNWLYNEFIPTFAITITAPLISDMIITTITAIVAMTINLI